MRCSSLLLGLCLCSASLAQTAPDAASRFIPQITKRQTPTIEEEQREAFISPSEKAIRQLEKEQFAEKNGEKNPVFVDWMKKTADVVAVNKAARRAQATYTQKMDSVVRLSQAGTRISKQVFTYTDAGLPLYCTNYVPDTTTGEWAEVGHYSIEYDGQGRLSAREVVDNTTYGQSARYEYFYSDDTPYYTQQLYYTLTDDEWVPSQRAEYTYDSNYNTIDEKHAAYDSDNQIWTYVERTTATYDDQNRMTSYYPWKWDATTDGWVAQDNQSGNSWEYTASGKDAKQTNYEWNGTAWQAYNQIVYTYNADDNIAKVETSYWNSDKQDWSGGYVTDNGYTYYNSRQDYAYDDKGRQTSVEQNGQNSQGEWSLISSTHSTYTDNEDGGYDQTTITSLRWVSRTPSPYQKVERTVNKFGSVRYYKASHYNRSATMEIPYEEEIRTMDENNNYISGNFYSFYLDSDSVSHRYGNSREYYTYSEDYVSRPNHMTPIYGDHWNGTNRETDTTWVQTSHDDFEWTTDNDGNDVLLSTYDYSFINGVQVAVQGGGAVLDFDTPISQIAEFPISNKTDRFYTYKTLSETTLLNYDYWRGDTEWDPENSYTDTFYYSDFSTTGINTVDSGSTVGNETARYNINGQRIAQPQKGVNLVRYSNGKTVKVIVR